MLAYSVVLVVYLTLSDLLITFDFAFVLVALASIIRRVLDFI